jgi:hypothetical protein
MEFSELWKHQQNICEKQALPPVAGLVAMAVTNR